MKAESQSEMVKSESKTISNILRLVLTIVRWPLTGTPFHSAPWSAKSFDL